MIDFYLLFITRSIVGRDVKLFVVVIIDVVAVGEDATDVLVDEEELETLLGTVVLVAILIMVYPSRREE